MSEASYQSNVRRGVTGPRTSTCLMAAYDRISLKHGISPATYSAYEDLRMGFVAVVGDGSNYVPREIREQFGRIKIRFRHELGVRTPRNVLEAKVDTVEELDQLLYRLTR